LVISMFYPCRCFVCWCFVCWCFVPVDVFSYFKSRRFVCRRFVCRRFVCRCFALEPIFYLPSAAQIYLCSSGLLFYAMQTLVPVYTLYPECTYWIE
jgi:hypothetical protein